MTTIENSICWTVLDINKQYRNDFSSVISHFRINGYSRNLPTVDLTDEILFESTNIRSNYVLCIIHPDIANVVAFSGEDELKVDMLKGSVDSNSFESKAFFIYCSAKNRTVNIKVYGQSMSDDIQCTVYTVFGNDSDDYRDEVKTKVRGTIVKCSNERPIYQVRPGTDLINVIYDWTESATETKIELYADVKQNLIILNHLDLSDHNDHFQTFRDLAFGKYCVCISQYGANGKLIYKSPMVPVSVSRS